MVNKFMNMSEFLINKYQEEGRYLVENAYELVEAEMDSFGGVDKDSWNRMIYSTTQVNYVYKTLYLLSLITDSHAVSSRYPMNNFNPIDFYTPNLPMVENFGFLINTTEKVMDTISYVYEEHAKNVASHKE